MAAKSLGYFLAGIVKPLPHVLMHVCMYLSLSIFDVCSSLCLFLSRFLALLYFFQLGSFGSKTSLLVSHSAVRETDLFTYLGLCQCWDWLLKLCSSRSIGRIIGPNRAPWFSRSGGNDSLLRSLPSQTGRLPGLEKRDEKACLLCTVQCPGLSLPVRCTCIFSGYSSLPNIFCISFV